MPGTDSESIRLNKYIASSGLCSRREADTLIENGKVTINGVVAIQGSKVDPGDIVEVSGLTVKGLKPGKALLKIEVKANCAYNGVVIDKPVFTTELEVEVE